MAEYVVGYVDGCPIGAEGVRYLSKGIWVSLKMLRISTCQSNSRPQTPKLQQLQNTGPSQQLEKHSINKNKQLQSGPTHLHPNIHPH